jgi:hypothetical protein
MKNIQVIDGAENAIYDIFAATDEEFDLIFPSGQDIAFSDEVWQREPKASLEAAFAEIWKRPVRKRDAIGIQVYCSMDSRIRRSIIPLARMRKRSILMARGYANWPRADFPIKGLLRHRKVNAHDVRGGARTFGRLKFVDFDRHGFDPP